MPKRNYLYTAKEISDMEIFGPKEFISPYKITQNWAKNGLKFIRGNKKELLFRLEWIEEYIEFQAVVNQKEVEVTQKEKSQKRNVREFKNCFTKVH